MRYIIYNIVPDTLINVNSKGFFDILDITDKVNEQLGGDKKIYFPIKDPPECWSGYNLTHL